MRRLLRALYLSPLARPLSALARLAALPFRPFMLYGMKCPTTGQFRRHSRVSSSAVFVDRGKLEIGDHVWIWHYSIVDCSGGVKIGRGCQIGAWVGIYSHSSHLSIRLLGERYIEIDRMERGGYVNAPVEIGEFTFIGGGAMIMPGVKIGRGCVILGGSLVAKDVPDFMIAGGNPARVVGDCRQTDLPHLASGSYAETYYDPALRREILERAAATPGPPGK